jgi:hypothetical protein
MKHNPDYAKNKTADVKKKPHAVPQDHWEMDIDLQALLDPWGACSGKNRPSTHIRVNECDH